MKDLAPNPAVFSSLRVLIADDKPFIRSIVQSMLTRLKVKEVLQAANGEQASALLRKYGNRIGCIVSDWNMDPVGGLELLRLVRSGQILGLPANTCFIMLTGHAKENVVKTALALDVNAYLVKPISFEKLFTTMETALARDVLLRQSLYYRTVVDVQVPEVVKVADRHVPTWLKDVASSPQRTDLQQHIRMIREEVQNGGTAQMGGDSAEIRNMRRIPMGDVVPGCVLAEDVYADDRDLLVGAGTILSDSMLGRLKEIAGAAAGDAKIWIGDVCKPASGY